MTCPTKSGEVEIIVDYCARKLSADRSSLLERHLPECEACRQTAAAQLAVWASLDSFGEVTISADFDRRLYARIEAEEARRNPLVKWALSWAARWSPLSWRPALPAAAACATLLAAVLIQFPDARAPLPAPQPQAQMQKIDVDQVERALDDIDMLKQLGTAANPNSGS